MFDKYANLGQLSLGVARQEILRSAETQLQLLGARPKELEEARRLATKARERFAEADAGVGDIIRLREEGAKADEKARDLFLKVLDTSPSAQDALLEGIRRKIAQQQYELDSIPFEIIQNADDAATEYLTHCNLESQESEFAKKFVLHRVENEIHIIYGGRPINDACGKTGAPGDRWRRDLVKMLLLNGSDKNIDDDDRVTGKFGLGFKSVFLLSSTPKVVSSRLGFEIVGGIWPRPLPKDDCDSMHSAGEEHFGDYPRRTIIRLCGESEKIDKSIERFKSLAPWLPVFTRSLRTLVLCSDTKSTTYQWSTKVAGHTNRIKFGKIGKHQHMEISDDQIQWLFRIENGRFVALPDSVPWLWVTTPTRETGIGLALNAPFALDPGRTRLSNHHEDVSTTNHDLLRRAVRLFREELSTLLEAGTHTDDLALAQPVSFWTSLWKLLTRIPRVIGEPEGVGHLSNALWPSDLSEGYARLIKEHRVLPSGLHPPLENLTSLSHVQYAITGWLATSGGCRSLKSAIERHLVKIRTESECCSDSVYRELRDRLNSTINPFGLVDLLKGNHEIEHRIDPELANIVAEGLFAGHDEAEVTLQAILSPQEMRDIESLAESLRFLSDAGKWEGAETLLVPANQSVENDESKRSAFAPPDRVLSRAYSKEATKLFTALRGKLRADAKTLCEWITSQADYDAALRAGLLYLATGELREEMARHLGAAWIKSISSKTAYRELDLQTRESINCVFDKAEIENKWRYLQGEPVWAPMVDDEDDELLDVVHDHHLLSNEDILINWEHGEALRLFTLNGPLRDLVLPGAPDDKVMSSELKQAGSLNGKIAWYRMLCLGCTLSIPRGRCPASGVLSLWNDKLGHEFWEHTIPQSLSDHVNNSFNLKLDEFFRDIVSRYFKNENASGEDAEFWRRVFYDFRKMHHFVFHNHLPETILEFAEFPEADGPRLITFLRSGHIPDDMRDTDTTKWFQGVIGQSMKTPLLFMMRELRRLDVLNNRFDPVCYYMNSPARRTARRLGWLGDDTKYGGDISDLVDVSRCVHEKMLKEIPTLAKYYDLPLQLYAQKNQQ